MEIRKIKLHFKRMDPVIYKVIATMDFEVWVKPHKKKANNYFVALCREITGQQLSGKAADTIYGRFGKLFSGDVYTPKEVLGKTDEQLRQVGLSWAKVKYVKNIATAFDKGEIDDKHLHNWSDEEVIEHLIKIKGIGRWTAEMFLMFTLGRQDVFSYGDLGLKKGLEKVYGLKNPEKPEIESIIMKWSPYKSFGSFALWQSLEKND